MMANCVQGRWGGCIYAVSALVEDGVMRGALTMRCKLTGKHPDECAEGIEARRAETGNTGSAGTAKARCEASAKRR